jgi:hypothetical protein
MALGVAGQVGHCAVQHAWGSRQGPESVTDRFLIMADCNVQGTQPRSLHAIHVQVGNYLASAVNKINICLYTFFIIQTHLQAFYLHLYLVLLSHVQTQLMLTLVQ